MKRTHKLRNRKGFTLAETLLAVLILLLVSGIVARGIPVAASVYEKTVLSANAQSLLSTTVSALRDELGTAWDVQVDETHKMVSYYSADTGNRSELEIVEEDGQKNIRLTEYAKNAGLNDKDDEDSHGIGKPRQLIPGQGATLTKDLDISYQDVTYDRGVIVFTNIQVKPKGKTEPVIAEMRSLSIKVISALLPTPESTPESTD